MFVCVYSTVNKTDFSLQTQNWWVFCSSTPLPLLFFSCQCQRSGSVNGPDGCRTQSPLSPFIPPSYPQTTVLFKPPLPTLLHLSFSSLLTLLYSLFCLSHGAVTEDTLLSVAQGSAVKPFPSLTSQAWWLCVSCIISLRNERSLCRQIPRSPPPHPPLDLPYS